jgi:preprotein translocase subunit SecF
MSNIEPSPASSASPGQRQLKFVTIFDPKSPIDFVKRGPLAIWIGFGLCGATLLTLLIAGMNWGIDFAGGTEMQVQFKQDVAASDVRHLLEEQGFDKHQVQQYGDAANKEILVRVERITTITDADIAKLKAALTGAFGADAAIEFVPTEGDRVHVTIAEPKAPDEASALRVLDEQQAKLAQVIENEGGMKLRRTKKAGTDVEDTTDAIVRDEPYQGHVKYLVQFQGVTDKLQRAFQAKFGDAEIRRVDFVDAQVAQELRTDGLVALLLTLLFILIYVALRFDIFFAPGAVIALAHDPIGAMALYAFGRIEFDQPSIAALLTIVGYSINNTIVIYDRIRETTPATTNGPLSHEAMAKVVNQAVNDTLSRTINSTMTVFLAGLALFIFTDGAVRNFAAVFSVGVILGAFSSTFTAPAIYLWFRKHFFNPDAAPKTGGLTREERERGVV